MIDLTLQELRTLRADGVTADELRRAKDHLKGSLMLSLESTGSRMTRIAKQELYFSRAFTLDEILATSSRRRRTGLPRAPARRAACPGGAGPDSVEIQLPDTFEL